MAKQTLKSSSLALLLIFRFGRAILLTNNKYAAFARQEIEELRDSYDEFVPEPEAGQFYEELLQINGSKRVQLEEIQDGDLVMQSFNSFPFPQGIKSAGGLTVPTNIRGNQVVSDEKRSLLFYFLRAILPDPRFDDRVIVQNSLDMPFQSIGQIGKGCTGTVIGSRHVLTSAHCVFNFVNKRAFPDLSFQPALNIAQSPKDPYPIQDWLYTFFPDQFANERNEDYDYAVIVLKDPLPKNITAIAYGNDCVQGETHNVNIAGYPLEKEPKDAMWTTSCVNIKINCTQLYFSHNCDTTTGMSGSGMITSKKDSNDSTRYTIRGIHQGYKDSIGKNVAIYINKQVEQQIKDFLRAFP